MPGRQPKVHYRNSNIGIIEPSWKLSTLHLFYEKYLHLFIYLYIHIIQREMRYGERDVSPRRRRRSHRCSSITSWMRSVGFRKGLYLAFRIHLI